MKKECGERREEVPLKEGQDPFRDEDQVIQAQMKGEKSGNGGC